MKKTPLLLLIILVLPLIQGEDWQSYESEHFIFYYDEDYLTADEIATIAQNQEALFTEICNHLGIEFTEKIEYYLYGDRKEWEGIPGAYAMLTEIRFLCIFCVDFCKEGLNDAHEMTHALSTKIGFQHGFLAEGLAVYVEDYCIGGENLHGIIRILHEEGRLTPLEDLIEDYWCDILYNYDIAGSFAVFLIEEYGIEKFKELYAKPPGYFAFLEVYDKSIYVLEAEWIAVVGQAEVTQRERDLVRYRDSIEEGLAIYIDLEFGEVEYGAYPARAEEGICLFREQYKDNPEGAFTHLAQFNEGMVAWKEAIETFEKALEQQGYQEKAESFGKAAFLYEIAGDEDMITLSQKYATTYGSLQKVLEYLEQGDTFLAGQELNKAKLFSEELGIEEEIFIIEQQVQASEEQIIQGFEVAVILILVGILVIRVALKMYKNE